MSREMLGEISAEVVSSLSVRFGSLIGILVLIPHFAATPTWGQQSNLERTAVSPAAVNDPHFEPSPYASASGTPPSEENSSNAGRTQVAGGADSTPDDPPAAARAPTSPGQDSPPRSFGPPPPPRFSLDGWFIGESELSGIDSQIAMSFLSVSHGRQFRKGFTTLNVRPQFQTLFLGGPNGGGPGISEQVYGLTLDLQVDQPLSRKFGVQLGITPGLYTDFRNLSAESFRVPARLFGSYVFGPKLIVLGGLVYTAQPNLPFIPAAGFLWKPSERWRLEAIAPRPRLVYTASDRLQVYALFSFDSSTYAIESITGDELLQYRDFRVALGGEWTTKGKLRIFSEAGTAFSRRLDLERQPDRNVEPGIFVRAGLRF